MTKHVDRSRTPSSTSAGPYRDPSCPRVVGTYCDPPTVARSVEFASRKRECSGIAPCSTIVPSTDVTFVMLTKACGIRRAVLSLRPPIRSCAPPASTQSRSVTFSASANVSIERRSTVTVIGPLNTTESKHVVARPPSTVTDSVSVTQSRSSTTATGPRRRHVERQARLAHAAGTAAAHAVGERRSQRIEACQRGRTAVARHHAHGGQAGHAVVAAALQHTAASTVALHRHDATRDRQPGDKRRAGGSAARNRHGAAAQRQPRQRCHGRRLAHRPHAVQVQPPAATDRPTVAAHQQRRNRPLDAHEAQHRIKHREALSKHNASATAHNRHVRHGEHRVAPQTETRRGRHMHRGRGRTARRLQRHAVKHHRARQQVHTAANVHRRPARLRRPQHSVAHTQLRLQQRRRVQHKRRRHRVRQPAQLGVVHRPRRHNRRVTDRHVRVCRQVVHKHERAVAPGQPAHAHLQAPVTRRLAAVAPHVDLRTAIAHAVPQFDAQRTGKHRRNV
ncbi:hypothetical protein ECC02_008961 [Trypanosoma cruzi]|uniref:Uncharacterized protein n=1 Tax=Trypanosoma cruzi TaxID=5693 RepID=A0A7J6XV72_TRYCR|nr:hypothetical protein ECC02_008961 [Trypanosoma cruzi]